MVGITVPKPNPARKRGRRLAWKWGMREIRRNMAPRSICGPNRARRTDRSASQPPGMEPTAAPSRRMDTMAPSSVRLDIRSPWRKGAKGIKAKAQMTTLA
jgi:hypothetical protein